MNRACRLEHTYLLSSLIPPGIDFIRLLDHLRWLSIDHIDPRRFGGNDTPMAV